MEGKWGNLKPLEDKIGYRFRKPELLLRSLTHPSFNPEKRAFPSNYQRLEFLGDAILSAILAERLFHQLPEEREGSLTKSRSALSRGSQLSSLSRQLGLPPFIRLSENEELNGGRTRDSILEDVLEALIGAIYLDSDWETIRKVVLSWYGDIAHHLESLVTEQNPKGRLQELVQPILGNDAIEYPVSGETGPAHDKSFEVEVKIQGRVMGTGKGPSKKEAEETAARMALLKWPREEAP